MSDRKKSGLKKQKENTALRDPNFELGVKVTFIVMMYVLNDCEILDKPKFDFIKERFIKHLESFKEGRIKLEDMIGVLKEEYNYTRMDF